MPGYIQIYTGNGKGKTTAALGLALRAAGAGLKVFIGQFLKTKTCSEHKALERFKDLITVITFGRPGFVTVPTEEDKLLAEEGWKTCAQAIHSGQYSLVIMDEINVAIHKGLLDLQEVLEVIKARPKDLEVILTGRYAPSELVEIADLVTEMKEKKHYYERGIKAREGFEY
ncbi:MAG: cob(I)yrinic acid a,c-diamide adenosyltransferase [Candidatus Desulfofervidaceae bacterium]|nr:cob(I)yrinic acid a,c-diamide adenosyltransferase [Candidatus Desulfofervidaceae bacterium]